MTWAIPADVTDRWVGSDAPTDTDLMTALIADAETVILSVYPRIQERIDANTLSLETVKLVVVRMVTRVLRNPENVTYLQQTTGPFGQAKNYGSTSFDIWLSTEERTLLAPSSRGKAFSLNTAPNMNSARYVTGLPGTDEPVWIDNV